MIFAHLKIVSLPRDQLMASMPSIDSLTRQLIPFAPTVLRPLRFRTTLFTLVLSLRSTQLPQ